MVEVLDGLRADHVDILPDSRILLESCTQLTVAGHLRIAP